MPWSRGLPSNPKYKTRQHRMERAKWAKLMAAQGYLVCAQPVCVMGDRTIGKGQAWHAGHDETGTSYIGPVHAECNVKDAAVRANQRSQGVTHRWAL